jgi:transaldolase
MTRDLLNTGMLRRYIDKLSVTGLASNPTIFRSRDQEQHCLRRADSQKLRAGTSGEALFFELRSKT